MLTNKNIKEKKTIRLFLHNLRRLDILNSPSSLFRTMPEAENNDTAAEKHIYIHNDTGKLAYFEWCSSAC